MIVYKIDVIAALKEAGYTQNGLIKRRMMSAKSLTDIRNGRMVGIIVIDKLCKLLDMQPGNIIKYKEDDEV